MRRSSCVVAALILAAGGSQAFGLQFTSGNLVVLQLGTGAASLNSAATAAFLKEYSPTGTLVQTITSPTAASGPNRALTLAGSSTAEGALTLSSDGRYLTYCGYDAAPGLASVASSTTAAAARVVGRVDLMGNIDTSTVITDALSGNAIRSSVTNDGSGYWIAGGNGGFRYVAHGSGGTSTQLNSSNPSNGRVMNIYNGQLYGSTGAASFSGVNTIGSGLPTTSGTTVTVFPGEGNVASQSVYDYFFASSSVMYVANDSAANGGLEKWTYNGSTWSLAYRITTGLNSVFIRQLCGMVDENGNAILYATTTETNANRIVTLSDVVSATSYSGTGFTLVAQASSNTVFRGIDFVPVPAPASGSLLALAGAVAFRRRRAS